MTVVVLLYLIKFVHLYLSALQIRHGFVHFPLSFHFPLLGHQSHSTSYPANRFYVRTLMDWKDPGTLANTFFMLYRAIPFVYEIRTFLDWTLTTTSQIGRAHV